MPSPVLDYTDWRDTCDTLHAHTQVLGKIATRLAPPEPELQHAALRLTARGWETQPLPAPDGSGAFGIALDLLAHEAVLEHSGGRIERIPLTPNRPVAEVTRGVLSAARVFGEIQFDPKPQETDWQTPLDEDVDHATYDPAKVAQYLAAAHRAAIVLAEFRAPWRGRSTPVNAWWGSFDLAVSLFSGAPADPPSDDFIMRNAMDAQEVAVGWWPGDSRYPRAAFYAYAHPAAEGVGDAKLSSGGWNADLGEYVLDCADAETAHDPHAAVLAFTRAVTRHLCDVCAWDPTLTASLEGDPPPVS